jgi:hypothetical protein
MENTDKPSKENLNVPEQIFQCFFDELRKTSITPEIINQLQLAIGEKENPSDVAIKTALFSTNSTL